MYFFIIAGVSWFVAQTMKVVLESIINKKIDLRRYCGDGGYPSCHSSFITGGFVSVLMKYNWSKVFEIDTNAMVLSLFAILWVQITRDAMGSRLEQGQTANSVNELVKFLDDFTKQLDKTLFPMLKQNGHFPHQVVAGHVTGLITAISMDMIFDQANPLMAIVSALAGFGIVIYIGLAFNRKKKKEAGGKNK